MEPTNATFTLERIEGENAIELWHERIRVRYGCEMGIRLLTDEYGTNWLFWDRHRLGLFNPSQSLQHRVTLTADT